MCEVVPTKFTNPRGSGVFFGCHFKDTAERKTEGVQSKISTIHHITSMQLLDTKQNKIETSVQQGYSKSSGVNIQEPGKCETSVECRSPRQLGE